MLRVAFISIEDDSDLIVSFALAAGRRARHQRVNARSGGPLTDFALMRFFLLTLLLAGCSTGPAIAPMATAPDVFVLTRESPAGFPMKDKLQAEALEEARKYCEARQAVRQVVDSQTSTGWNMTGNTPRFQVRFRCVPQAEPTPK